jgi:hypothetical protein
VKGSDVVALPVIQENAEQAKNAMNPRYCRIRHSPRMGIPLRRKKSSGGSRPIMEKTTSLGSGAHLAVGVLEIDLVRSRISTTCVAIMPA